MNRRLTVVTTEVECLVRKGAPSYCIEGRRQQYGDRARLPVGLARLLEAQGKCRVVPNTLREETEGIVRSDGWW